MNKWSVNSILYLLICLFAGCRNNSTQPMILLYAGIGASSNDVKAVEKILKSNHLIYTLVDSDQLNQMNDTQYLQYKLMIIPGGNFIEMGGSLSLKATNTINKAVNQGLNYLGICAGGFLAGTSAYYNFLKLVPDVQFGFYAISQQGIRISAVPITEVDGRILQQYWEDGPEFTGWGEIISKYPDGTPATVQGNYGRGWIVLTGIHPEAPNQWRQNMNFSTSVHESHEYATRLITSALQKTALPHF